MSSIEDRIAVRYMAKMAVDSSSILDPAAKTAQKRLGDLKKVSDTLKKLGSRGSSFDSRDSKKLDATITKLFKMGETSYKAGKSADGKKFEVTKAVKPALRNLDNALRDWGGATRIINKDESRSHMKINGAEQVLGYVAKVLVAIIDLANAVKRNDPNELSVQDKEFAKLR